MGCSNTVNTNSTILNIPKIKNFIKSYRIIREIINSIYNYDEANPPLKVYLISTKSIPEYIKILNKIINNKDAIDKMEKIEENNKINENDQNYRAEFNIFNELGQYETENDFKIYDYQSCKEIKEQNNNEKNEFIIVNEEFLKIMNMEIPKKEDKTVELKFYKNVSKIQMTFPISHETIFIEKKKDKDDNYIFKFSIPKDKFNPNATLIYYSIINNNNKNSNNSNNNNNNFNINNNGLSHNYPVNPIYCNSIMNGLDFFQKKMKDDIINNSSDLIPLFYCIININRLRDYFLSNEDKILSIHNISILKEIYNIINEMKDGEKNLLNILNFYIFKKIIGNRKEIYDSKNLFNVLFEKIHNELNMNNNKTIVNNVESDHTNLLIELNNLWNNSGIKNKSIMTDIFIYEEIIMNQCHDCKTVTCYCALSNNFTFKLDDVINFKLKLNNNGIENVDLNDCFNSLTYDKPINNYNCKKCNLTSDCLSCYRINYPPEILTIILDRNDNYENTIEFKIDFNFDINNYLYKWETAQPENTKYELIGMISYFKKENSKHNAIFKSVNDNNWYIYNNFNLAIINNIDNEDKGYPYLLFYQKSK